MKKDIFLYYLFSFFLGLYIADGITVLFEQALHFSYTKIFILGGAYMLMFILFEIPSGALADLIGRKKTVALGALFITIAAILTGISNTFPQIVAIYLLWALGFSCVSSASEALLYDRINNERTYGNVIGRSTLLGLIGMMLAGALGPYLFDINFRLPYLISAIPFFISGICILFFTEHREAPEKFSIAKQFKQMRLGAVTAMHNRHVRWATGVMALTFAVMYTIGNAYQPYLQNIGFSVKLFSIILPIMYLVEGLGGSFSEKFYEFIGENKLFWGTIILLAISLIVMGGISSRISVIALFTYALMQGISRPLLSIYSNRHIEASQRATVISVQNTISTFVASIPMFAFGYFSDKFGLGKLLIFLGCAVFIFGIFLLAKKPTTR